MQYLSKRNRNPRGLAVNKPIALRLMPDERKEAETLSVKAQLTKSAFARECYLLGLTVKKSLPPADTGTAVMTA